MWQQLKSTLGMNTRRQDWESMLSQPTPEEADALLNGPRTGGGGAPSAKSVASGPSLREQHRAAAAAKAVQDGAGDPSRESANLALVGLMGEDLETRAGKIYEALSDCLKKGEADRNTWEFILSEVRNLRNTGSMFTSLAQLRATDVRTMPEPFKLHLVAGKTLSQRVAELRRHGVDVVPNFKSCEVVADKPLTESLINSAIEWSLFFGNRLNVSTLIKDWPEVAMVRIQCDTPVRDGTQRLAYQTQATLQWQLVQELAATATLDVVKTETSAGVTLDIEFPQTISERDGISTFEMDSTFEGRGRSLAGLTLTALIRDPIVRMQVDAIVRSVNMKIEFVETSAALARSCEVRVPNGIIAEARLVNDDVNWVIGDIQRHYPQFPVIELVEERNVYDISGFLPGSRCRLSQSAISQNLQTTLVFELLRV